MRKRPKWLLSGDIREKDYPKVARIWHDVLDIPVTDERLAETYGKIGKDDRYATFIAEENGKAVGLVATVVCLAIGNTSGYAKINGLGVLPEHRGNGIGRMLIEKAEEFAKANGTTYLGLASGL